MHETPSDQVLRAFGLSGLPERLKGGEGRAWLAGNAVVKPCDARAEWSWLAEHMPTVRQEGFRLAAPLRAFDGRWVVDGWCAQTAIEGSHPADGRWAELLLACELFHCSVQNLPRPTFLGARTDPWALGDRVAWEEAALPGHKPIRQLAGVRRKVLLRPQFLHGDMTENVLFAEGHDPAVIDIAPYWRPAGFASAVVVADAICWHAADPEEVLDAVVHVEEFPQLLVRALIYRMTTTVESSKAGADLEGYEFAVDLALRLASSR